MSGISVLEGLEKALEKLIEDYKSLKAENSALKAVADKQKQDIASIRAKFDAGEITKKDAAQRVDKLIIALTSATSLKGGVDA